MASYGQRLKIRLFLEGVEVPVISANIQTAPNSPMMASLQILPLSEATQFLPRTTVHLFFLDMYEQKSPFISNSKVEDKKKNPTAYERQLQTVVDQAKEQKQSGLDDDELDGIKQGLSDTFNDRYKLLFCGEVIGFQWTKNVSSRSVVLQCADFSNYWDYAYQWNNTGIFGPGVKAMFSGGATNLFTDFLFSKGNVITQIVTSGKCNTYPKMGGLAAGIVRLIEAIGGTYAIRRGDQSVKRLAGQNMFFSVAELRLHVTQMIAAFEDDPTTQRLIGRQGYSGLFNRVLGNLGGQTSIRKAINALTAIIFHETYSQPCPYYVPGLAGEVSGSERRTLREHPDLEFVGTLAENSKDTLQRVFFTLGDTEQVEEADLFTGGLRESLGRQLQLVRTNINRAQSHPSVRKGPEVVRSHLSQASTSILSALNRLPRWRPRAPDSEREPLLNSVSEALASVTKLTQLTVQITKPKDQEPARLMQQVLRPDIWFGAPPRCNVVFPEDYEQIVYQRMFLQEPTRFLLKTNDEFFGEDFLFDKFYFAPQAGGVKEERARLASIRRGDLLDHELFTGILPVFEKMGEFNIFASRIRNQKNPTKVSFAQRSANFLYFKHRFNSRQMRVAGKFNPYIACGCPGLIIDKYVDQDAMARRDEMMKKKGLAVQDRLRQLGVSFLGNFTEVSHAVSQAETRGRTEINVSYPRQVDESVEFLGAVEKVQTVQKRQEEDALRATDIAALSAPKLFSLGPLGGRIVRVTEVTQLYRPEGTSAFTGEQTEESGKPLPLFGRRVDRDKRQRKVPRVPVGVPTSAARLGSEDVEDIVGDATREVVFRAFRVEEEVPRYRREQVDLPAEEFIRPGWYGDVWSSGKIGRVYETFFGIGSITDPQQVSDPLGASIGVQNEKVAQAQDEASEATSSDDPKKSAPILLELGENASIEQAVEFLVLTYSHIRQQGLDVDDFIRSYTWRPIASLVDMFGTSDLEFNTDGTSITSGIEGFHSRAFGNYSNLFGLVSSDVEDILGIKRNSEAAQRADTRARKHEAVLRYVSQILFSRGLLG